MSNRKSNSERKCGFCGEVGHYRSTCPKIKDRRSPISLPTDDDSEISQFSPNKTESPPKASEKRVLRPRTRSSVVTSRTTVVDNSNDSDFQPSSNSASDLPEMLSTQEAEDLAATFQEVLNDSPPKPPTRTANKKKKKQPKKKKKKQPNKSSVFTPPRRVPTPKNGPKSFTPLKMHKIQTTSQASTTPPPSYTTNKMHSRPLLPNTQLNQRWFPPPPSRNPYYSSQFTGASSHPPRPQFMPQYRPTILPSNATAAYSSSTSKYVPPNFKYLPPRPPQKVTLPAPAAPTRVVAPPLPPPIKIVSAGRKQPATNFTPKPLEIPQPPPSVTNPPAQPQAPAPPAVEPAIDSPDQSELMQLQQLGLNMLFGVSHELGGGVYLSRRDATVAAVRFHNEGRTVAKIRPFQRNDIPLSRLETLVEAWVRLSQPVPNSPDNFFPGSTTQHTAAPTVSATATTPGECIPPQNVPHMQPHSSNPSNLPPLLPNAHPHSTLHPLHVHARTHAFQHPPTYSHAMPPYSNHVAYPPAQHVGRQYPTPCAPAVSMPFPQHQLHTHHHPPTLPPPPTPEFRSPTEWAFSQNDVTFAKQLMQQGSSPLRELEKAPDPATLVYLAPPGTCKGIFTDNSILSGGHSVEFDPTTGSLRMKPKATATLPLMPFTKMLNLFYRTIDSAATTNSPLFASVVRCLQRLIRMLIRQHGSLTAAGYPDTLPQMMAYLQCTCMARSRILFYGSSAEAAFEKEASRRLLTNTGALSIGTPKSNSVSSENWKICPCCGLVNDHVSTACPTQSKGPTKTPAYTRAAVKAAIAAAPITPSARDNLTKMCSALWAKIERDL